MTSIPRPDSLPDLDGPFEPNNHPVWTALLGLLVAFILFQGISLVVSIGLLLGSGVTLDGLVSDMEGVLADNAGSIIIANTVGQILGLLIPALLFVRLHTRSRNAFLRLVGVDAGFAVLAVLGLVALIPVVSWLGTQFDALPWPDAVRDFEQGQMALIENILGRNFNPVFIVAALALTPAICEEVLFRGYVQRQFERGAGVAWGVALSGIIFGLYHLRPTQAIPLSILGLYLAWLTWRSGSLIPAILIHFLNNAFAALIGNAAPGETTEAALETFEIPLAIFLPALVVFAGLVVVMHRHGASLSDRKTSSLGGTHEKTDV